MFCIFNHQSIKDMSALKGAEYGSLLGYRVFSQDVNSDPVVIVRGEEVKLIYTYIYIYEEISEKG